MTLLICPLRPDDRNEELRYALRSWEANLRLPEAPELLVVGHKPPWLDNVGYVETETAPHSSWDVFGNILLGSLEAINQGHGDNAIYMNDDFFCLRPVNEVGLVRRDATLGQHVALLPSFRSNDWWRDSLQLTEELLINKGLPTYSFEVHRPLHATPRIMAEALNAALDEMDDARFKDETGCNGEVPPQWRSLYGNHLGGFAALSAPVVDDPKLGASLTRIHSDDAWISTTPQAFRRLFPILQKRFPKPSRWEKS